MARYAVLSTLVMLILVVSSQAAQITFSTRSEPTPGMATHTTWILTANSSHPMQGFDFAGDGSNDPATGKGFFGPMNQVNPAGQPTVYSDNNPIITALGGNPKQDSQFTVRSADVVVPAGFAEEGANTLQGIWAHSAPVGTTFDIAQLVIPNGPAATVNFRGTISTLEGTQIVENNVGGAPFFGQPPHVVDATLTAFANSIVTHTFTATDSDTPPQSLSWFDFSFNGPRTANQPTFNPQSQAFRWDTTGSKPGTYLARVTVTDFAYYDTGTLTIHLVPEPVGTTLIGLVLIGLVSFPRRR